MLQSTRVDIARAPARTHSTLEAPPSTADTLRQYLQPTDRPSPTPTVLAETAGNGQRSADSYQRPTNCVVECAARAYIVLLLLFKCMNCGRVH
jgi:hypothetical protein